MPATIRVTSLLDSGAGTLRAAIEQADRAPNHGTLPQSVAQAMGVLRDFGLLAAEG